MNWRCCLVSFGIVLAVVIAGISQSSRFGRVEVVMPQTAPELPGFSPEIRKFTIFAVSGNKKYKLKRTWRESYSGGDYLYVARYQKNLPAGRYALSIKGNEDYLLPKFQLEPGETYTIYVPIARLPLSRYACFDGMFSRDKGEFADGKPIQTEIFETGGQFDISVHFCSRERYKDMVVYKPARIYYKDFFIVADEIKIDSANRTVTVNDDLEVICIKNGVFVENLDTTFSFKF